MDHTFAKIDENDSFDVYRMSNKQTEGIAIIFKTDRMNKEAVTRLRVVIRSMCTGTTGLYMDMSKITSASPSALTANADFIKEMADTSLVKRVALVTSKFGKSALTALFKISKPKVETMVFDQDTEAVNYMFSAQA